MLINIQNYHVLQGTTHGYYGNDELPEDFDYYAAEAQLNYTMSDVDDSELWRIGVFS